VARALAAKARGWVLAGAPGCVVFGLTFAAPGSAAACGMALAVAASGVAQPAAVSGSALAVAASVVTGFGAAPGGALSERAWGAGLAPEFDALWFGVALGVAVPAPGVAAVAGEGAGLAMGAAGL